jgi:transposase
LLDKFAWHLPLYRQHQRLLDNGIRVSRPGSRSWAPRRRSRCSSRSTTAQLASIRASRIKAMDETPIKAGRAGPGKMKGGYFWPVYGERDEICFPFFEAVRTNTCENPARARPGRGGVLLTDGYGAYERVRTKRPGSRMRNAGRTAERKFIKAESAEPELAARRWR